MSIEKTTCIVLSVIPYRETSSIATLLTRDHGRVSGIAKGIRRQTAAMPLALERGLLVETMLYVKPHRDLHTMGSISVLRWFPGIRSDLNKTMLRDAAFELAIRSVAASDSHGELFDFLLSFLDRLEGSSKGGNPPIRLLWSFFYGWAFHCGFDLNLGECVRCAGGRTETEGGLLSHPHGGLVCPRCGNDRSPSFLPAEVVEYLSASDHGAGDLPFAYCPGPREELRITRLLADYCRFHLDIRSEFKSLTFMESMAGC